MTKLNLLMDMYIKDTKVDGQKFCGCRIEDCDDYDKITKCRECLNKILEEERRINMNTQYFLGIDLFTWENFDIIDKEMLQFYNVKFPFKSMKQFNGNTVSFQLEGTLQICSDKSSKVLWEGFPTQIEEFKELLLERM